MYVVFCVDMREGHKLEHHARRGGRGERGISDGVGGGGGGGGGTSIQFEDKKG